MINIIHNNTKKRIMTTSNIYDIIKNSNNQEQTYIDLTAKYNKELVDLVYLVDFDIDINRDICDKHEREIRTYQQKLRNDAIIRYSGKCVISGETKQRLLEVAHIKPVSDCSNINEKKDINNTLLLWIDLHKYFDCYAFSINPKTYRIEVNMNIEEYEWLHKYQNMKIDCIDDKMSKYIIHHYTIFLKS